MKLLFPFFISSVFFVATCTAQTSVPCGLMLDIRGKVQIQTQAFFGEDVFSDTVFHVNESDTIIQSIVNYQPIFLELMEMSDPEMTLPTNLDPSKVYTTHFANDPHRTLSPLIYVIIPDTLECESAHYNTSTSVDSSEQLMCANEVYGLDIDVAEAIEIENLLWKHYLKYRGRITDYEDDVALIQSLTTPDTVVNDTMRYDYILDRALFHSYEKNRLFLVIGFHWGYGIEVMELRYDDKNRITEARRERAGSYLEIMTFQYNRKNQMVKTRSKRYFHFNDKDLFEMDDEHEKRFRYNKFGQVEWLQYRSLPGKWKTAGKWKLAIG